MSEIWAHVGEPHGGFVVDWSDVPGLTPGMAASMRRAEAVERHREQREAAERRERAETRVELWAIRRMQELSAAGQPFDPNNWQTLVEDPAVLAERVFHAQDVEARRLEFAAAREAGLVHLLSVSSAEMAAGETVLEPRDQVEDRAVRTELLQARRRTLREKIRAQARHALNHTGSPQ